MSKPNGSANDLQSAFDLDEDSKPASDGKKGKRRKRRIKSDDTAASAGPAADPPKDAPPAQPTLTIEDAPAAANGKTADADATTPAEASAAPQAADRADPPAAAAEDAGAEAPQEDAGPRVLRLVHSAEGCWKELEDGQRVDLSETEWRSELARQFKHEQPAREA